MIAVSIEMVHPDTAIYNINQHYLLQNSTLKLLRNDTDTDCTKLTMS